MSLADPVEAADALLEQVRVGRQVEQHQMVGELEVAAFAADFRADQHLGAELFVGEVGGGAVALKNAHAFVEHRGGDARTQAQGVFQVEGRLGVGTDDQDLELLEHLQGIDQPLDARVEAHQRLLSSPSSHCCWKFTSGYRSGCSPAGNSSYWLGIGNG